MTFAALRNAMRLKQCMGSQLTWMDVATRIIAVEKYAFLFPFPGQQLYHARHSQSTQGMDIGFEVPY